MVQEVEYILQKIGLVMDNKKLMQMHFFSIDNHTKYSINSGDSSKAIYCKSNL